MSQSGPILESAQVSKARNLILGSRIDMEFMSFNMNHLIYHNTYIERFLSLTVYNAQIL